MKGLIKNIALFITPLLIGIIVLFTIPLDKQFCYHFVKGECDNRASWIYNRVFENKEKIDIIFSGASQTSCAYMDEYIQNKIKLAGIDYNVANLGYCMRGRDVQYVMLKELFKHKNPKLLVLEVPEDEAKKSHRVFPYLAETNDLFGSFILFNQKYFSNLWKGLAVRFEQLKYWIFKNDDIFEVSNQKFGYMNSGQIVVTDEMISWNFEKWKKRSTNPKPEFLKKIDLNYTKHYFKKIAKLANDNDCDIMIVYIPEINSNIKIPWQYDFYEEIEKVIFVPDSILTNKNNWKDDSHFNDTGAEKFSEFISNILINKY